MQALIHESHFPALLHRKISLENKLLLFNPLFSLLKIADIFK